MVPKDFQNERSKGQGMFDKVLRMDKQGKRFICLFFNSPLRIPAVPVKSETNEAVSG